MAAYRPLAVAPELSDLAALARLLKTADSAPADELLRYASLVDRIGAVGADMALLGLLDVCGLFAEAVTRLASAGTLSAEALQGLRDWIPVAHGYAENPGAAATSAALVAHLRRPCWQIAMSDEDAESLLDMLCTVPSSAEQPAEQLNETLRDLKALSESLGANEPATADSTAELDIAAGPDHIADPDHDAELDVGADQPSAAQEPSAGLDEPSAGLEEPSAELDELSAALEELSAGLDAPAMEDQPSAGLDEPSAALEEPSAGLDELSAALDELSAGLERASLEFDEPLLELDQPAATLDEPFEALDELREQPAAPSLTIPPGVQDLLTIVIDELPQVSVAFDQLIGLAAASHVDAEIYANARDSAADMLERLGSTAESLGLAGLGRACGYLHGNLASSGGEDTREMITIAAGTWSALTPAIRDYLKSPYDITRAAALTALLSDSNLAAPLDAQGAAELVAILAHPEFANLEIETPSRPVVATPEDVSLDLPEDANPELVDALLDELPQQTEELSAAVQRLQSGGTLEDVTAAQRIAHTIKGAGNTVGVRGLAELTHQLEDILLALAKYETLPTPALVQTLITASDCLQGMAEGLVGTAPAPTDAVSVLQEVLDWANRIDREGPPSADGAESSDATWSGGGGDSPESASAAPESGGRSRTPESPDRAPRESGTPMLRVPSNLIDDLLRLVGEAMIQNSQLRERVRSTRQDARAMIRQFDLLQQIGTELEELIDLRDLSSENQHRASNRAFDALELDQYNELHTHSRRLIEAAVDAREIGRTVIDNLGNLNDMLVTQEHLNRDTQDGVLRTRMVPVKTVFPRLERSVRQTCRLTGKQVELNLSGGDTQMDSDVLGRIVDPLMHVLRNAVDHGIEAAEARESVGKDPTGVIALEFLRDGNSILVRCRDDGAGLDFDAIREVAEQRGLVAPGTEVADEVLKHFILLPNFTTRSKATQTSGRGIGLDAVQTGVAALGGSLTLHSIRGAGCTLEIRLPVSLLSSNALLVRTAGQVVAITSRGIEQIRHIHDGELRQYAGELVFQTGEQLIPARSLDSVLELTPPTDTPADDYGSVLIVRSERGMHAVLVRSVMASRDVVVKTLGSYIPRLHGVVGATILGDGSVTPVIDLAEILRAPDSLAAGEASASSLSSTENTRPRRALVVDDSLSARRSMAQVLSDAGFEVTTARDGMEAVELLERTLPDILFVDLEMPRMNGIELTSHVRARTTTSDVPIVMVTSRSTDKHRAQARAAGVNVYLTKPFDADSLLEQAERLLESQA